LIYQSILPIFVQGKQHLMEIYLLDLPYEKIEDNE